MEGRCGRLSFAAVIRGCHERGFAARASASAACLKTPSRGLPAPSEASRRPSARRLAERRTRPTRRVESESATLSTTQSPAPGSGYASESAAQSSEMASAQATPWAAPRSVMVMASG